MLQVTYDPIAVGDVRPVMVDVQPSDQPQAITSVTYTLFQKGAPQTVLASGACTITQEPNGYQRIATPAYTFNTTGYFIVQFKITWADGVVDYNLSALIQVEALPT